MSRFLIFKDISRTTQLTMKKHFKNEKYFFEDFHNS